MKAIINTKLLLEDSVIFDGAITFENGIIQQVGKRSEVRIPEDAEVLDAGGLYTAPGFVDIHNHGGPDSLFVDDPGSCCEFFLRHGQTTVLPTLYCDLTAERMLDGLDRIRSASESGAGRIIGGVYMEGPYMGGFGSNQRDILWGSEIIREEYLPLIRAFAGYAKVWAIDPARPGIERFMQDVLAEDPSAVFAMGHSRATAADCRRVRRWNLRLQTHHGDSGKAPGRAQGTIGAGCDEYALYDPEIYTELICDENGIHQDADMMRLLLRVKGNEKVILITDHMADRMHYKNNEAEGILFGPDLNYDYEGHLAGSHLTMDNACRNLIAHTGCGLCQAVRMASLNPARLLGMDGEIGSLEPGKRANLILIDDTVRVRTVFLNGEEQ